MPTIYPADRSYRIHSWFLTGLMAIMIKYLLSKPPQTKLELFRVASTLLLTTATYNLLYGRNITLQRVSALRFSHNKEEFKKAMRDKTILTANGMSTIFHMLLSSTVLSNLPSMYFLLVRGEVDEWFHKVDAPVSWFFGVVNLTIVAVCWVMVLTQEEVVFEFDQKVEETEVPLKKDKGTSKGGQDGWEKFASTSRRHDVWIKPVLLPNGQAVGAYDLATRLAPNHPLYNPDTETTPSGPILRIALP